ncbi:MAG: hypothetical protein DMD35_06460 [Gemmatimonadetes bacterium]|nr:MAG: hypothetical protein DMD35_06460 [Gemmatimonadota bacterium]
MNARATARPYADPYLAGVGLGLVLLASFVLAGRGLGASGAFATAAATSVNAVAPSAVAGNPYFADHLAAGGPLRDWLVVEILGVIVGGFLSASLAGRLALRVERGAHTSLRERLGAAMAGGVLMGGGAVLARGCTSGQALTGGALLSVGAWLFIGTAFAAAYLVAFVTRRSWT